MRRCFPHGPHPSEGEQRLAPTRPTTFWPTRISRGTPPHLRAFPRARRLRPTQMVLRTQGMRHAERPREPRWDGNICSSNAGQYIAPRSHGDRSARSRSRSTRRTARCQARARRRWPRARAGPPRGRRDGAGVRTQFRDAPLRPRSGARGSAAHCRRHARCPL